MIIGVDIAVLRQAAKDAAMRFFVGIAEADGTPPTLRAMYVLKTAEARTVAAGGASSYIEQEAALRGLSVEAMAAMILDLARQSEELELARMRANIAIDAATDESAIHAVLDPLGVSFAVDA